jgi:acyl carrier protein
MDAEIKNSLKDFILQEIVPEHFSTLEDDEPLISGGIVTSFSLARIATFMESHYGIEVADNDMTLEHFDTLARMVSFVRQHQEAGS